MKEKDQLFAASIIIAIIFNYVSAFTIMKALQNTKSSWVPGNVIQLNLYSISPALVLIAPFIVTPLLYKIYKSKNNIGLVLAGLWTGILGFDLVVRLYLHI